MALQAMWVHGNSASIQLNDRGRGEGEDVDGVRWTAVEGLRLGWGVQYRCQAGSSYWFHFPIPTPVIKDGGRAHLRRVMILFTSDPGVTLGAVDVWDGPGQPEYTRIPAADNLAIGGPHLTLHDGQNSFALPNNEVFWGIGVSVRFDFAVAGGVTLHAAGVDFEA